MKKIFALALPVVLLLIGAVTVLGQEKVVTPEGTKVVTPEGAVMFTRAGIAQGEKPATAPGVNTFTFVNSEFTFDGKPVKGAPYSAQAVTESTQTLPDGNRIVNRSSATLYRDSEGRTRREQTLKSIGGMTAGAEPVQTILISDPVAGVSYTLDPANKTARKNTINWQFQRTPMATGAGGSSNMVYFGQGAGAGAGQGTPGQASGTGSAKVFSSSDGVVKVTSGGETQVFTARTPAPGGEVKAASAGEPQVFTAQVPAPAAGVMTPFNMEIKNSTTEKLGKQNIEGVEAEGTRTTITIAAGTIGNERPIEIINERWYSAELQTVVMTRHADPRSGESVYRLTNIQRAEQPITLFEVPADYQMKEGPAAPMPARTRKPLD
jgi:hypothetical protein